MDLPKIVELHKRKIARWFYDTDGVLHIVYKNYERRPKTITAKPSGSIRHQGRTNCFGVRV